MDCAGTGTWLAGQAEPTCWKDMLGLGFSLWVIYNLHNSFKFSFGLFGVLCLSQIELLMGYAITNANHCYCRCLWTFLPLGGMVVNFNYSSVKCLNVVYLLVCLVGVVLCCWCSSDLVLLVAVQICESALVRTLCFPCLHSCFGCLCGIQLRSSG